MMHQFNLDSEWRFSRSPSLASSMRLDTDSLIVDMPFCARGAYAYFYKTVKLDESFGLDRATVHIEIEGLQGAATIFVDDHRVQTVGNKYELIDIGDYVHSHQFDICIAVHNILGNAGIAGAIKLHATDSVAYFNINGLSATTRHSSANFAIVDIGVEAKINEDAEYTVTEYDQESNQETTRVLNISKEGLPCELLIELLNHRGKRTTKRTRRFKLKKHSKIELSKIRLNKYKQYTQDNPYVYKLRASLYIQGNLMSTQEIPFGIRTFGIRKRKLALNNRLIWLNGIKIDNNNGVMGAVSTFALEQNKIAKIKQSGYNAIKVSGMPTSAFLSACDSAGMFCMVDIVDKQYLDNPFDNLKFERDYQETLYNNIRVLRKHPSVVAYGIADKSPIVYGRDDSANYAQSVVDIIRSQDRSRSITATVSELVPTLSEIQMYAKASGVRRVESSVDIDSTVRAISKENDIFRHATAQFCQLLDFVCYSDMRHRYSNDLENFPSRFVMGVDTPPSKIDQVDMDDLRYTNNILGDFSDGTDFDMFGKPKPSSTYRQILDGVQDKLAIATYQSDSDSNNPSNAQLSWDYPTAYGENIVVDVFTSGDVVALYLDDEIIGRKLAGRANKRKVRFEVPYKPGRLRAIGYSKGLEFGTEELFSVGFPKAIKLQADKRFVNVLDKHDIMIVTVQVVDDKGRPIDFTSREIAITVSPECQVVSYGNFDPNFVTVDALSNEIVVPVFEGMAQVAIRGLQVGKGLIVAESEGLKRGKFNVNIKAVAKESRGKANNSIADDRKEHSIFAIT